MVIEYGNKAPDCFVNMKDYREYPEKGQLGRVCSVNGIELLFREWGISRFESDPPENTGAIGPIKRYMIEFKVLPGVWFYCHWWDNYLYVLLKTGYKASSPKIAWAEYEIEIRREELQAATNYCDRIREHYRAALRARYDLQEKERKQNA